MKFQCNLNSNWGLFEKTKSLPSFDGCLEGKEVGLLLGSEEIGLVLGFKVVGLKVSPQK